MGLLKNNLNVSVRRQRIKRNNLFSYSKITDLWTWHGKNIKHRGDNDLYYCVKLPCIGVYSCLILEATVVGLGAADTNTNNRPCLDLHNMYIYCFLLYFLCYFFFSLPFVLFFDIISLSLVLFYFSLFSFFLSFCRVGECQLPFWYVFVKHYILYTSTPGYGMNDQLTSHAVGIRHWTGRGKLLKWAFLLL